MSTNHSCLMALSVCLLVSVCPVVTRGQDAPAVIQKVLGDADGVPKLAGLQAPWRIGAFLYVPDSPGDILVFRIGEDGTLAYGDKLAAKVEEGQAIRYTPHVFGKRLYVVERVGRGYQGRTFVDGSLAVYEFDQKAGARKELGRAKCPDAAAAAVAPDGRAAYVLPTAGGAILVYRIDEQGGVAPGVEQKNEAFTGRDLQISPDGKHLYWFRFTADAETKQETIFLETGAVQPDGGLAYGKPVQYTPPAGKIAYKALFLAPDGRHAYLYLWTYGKGFDYALIYARDPATGELKLLDEKNTFSGKMYKLTFLTAELGVCTNWKFGERSAVTLFRRDPATGLLTDCGDIKGVTGIGWIAWLGLQYDPARSRLYLAGNDQNKGLRGIYVIDLKESAWAAAERK